MRSSSSLLMEVIISVERRSFLVPGAVIFGVDFTDPFILCIIKSLKRAPHELIRCLLGPCPTKLLLLILSVPKGFLYIIISPNSSGRTCWE